MMKKYYSDDDIWDKIMGTVMMLSLPIGLLALYIAAGSK